MSEPARVLLVDAAAVSREMLTQAVRKVLPDAQVTAVGNEESFTHVLHSHNPDVVVTDYALGWCTGLDVIRRVRGQWPECPVVMVAGSGDEAVAVEAMKLGAADYVLKSDLHIGRLPAAIKSALNSREERLATRSAERRYRSLFEHLPMAVYRATFGGTIIDANQAFVDLFGWERPVDAIGESMVSLYVEPSDRERVVRDLLDAGEVRGRVVRLRRTDGRELWGDLTVRVLDDLSGHRVVEGMVRDITEERGAQQQARLLASALEAAADAIVVTDTTGAIEWINPSYTAITGYDLEEARQLRSGLLGPKQLGSDVAETMWETILAGRVWVGEIENRRKDGRAYAEQVSITPVRGGDGAIQHYVAVKRDVSEQRGLEAQFRQAQKMEAVGQLAGGIAHDFNNLMTAILGYCEILMEQIPQGDTSWADVNEIRSAGLRASSLTRQLLAFSRKQILQPATFDIRHTVAGLDKMLRRVIREDIALTIEQWDAPLPVRADIGQVEQVLINLVINASDAMPNGGTLRVSTRLANLDDAFVRTHPGATKGPYVAIEVRDTGTGMPPEVLTRIFEPFFTTKAQGKGTGLGLSMVYGIVKQSGGYIAAESRVGIGSLFTVFLPENLEPEPLVIAPQPKAWTRTQSSASILVAEDDTAIRELVCRVLARSGYTVIAGGTAREALASLDELGQRPDLLLTDVVMPDTNGVEFARILRARHPMMPVIFMSGYHDLEGISGGGTAAPDRLLQKPVTPEALLQAVHETLGTVKYGIAACPA
jgi:two-component system, cell cycle sensor histidine kinase and response regulator CckA